MEASVKQEPNGEPKMKTYTYEQNAALYRRAAQVIPCGIYGHYSPAPLVPVDAYPFFSVRGAGSHFWDADGNEFIDYMCAYGPMVLGYNHPKVDEAYLAQLKEGNTVTCAPRVMVELAEYFVDLMPMADWAYFAKNGGDVTNYAIMVARAATGRKKIIAIKSGYHGVAPWMQSLGHPGIIDADQENVIRIRWNDVSEVERVLNENPGQVAGMIATPYHHPVFADNELPADGYWRTVENLLHKAGALLIIDDVRTGFRLDMRGSHEYFGFKPDLVCLCKAIANGYPISALVGTEALKNDTAKVFYTGSYWFSAGPMAAAMACLDELKRLDGPKLMIGQGKKLCDGLVDIARSHGLDLKVTGVTSMPYLRITNDESLMFHQDVCGECTKRGAFFSSHHNWFLSTAHTDEDIQRSWDIFDDAVKAVKQRRSV
ncbi:MAG TPA: aminotransferase class III-fold pyridoxal phosphate-dependent enzyme [Candidatus Hydrogenedentes bacterium]|nr:aminotransferase class III-fold pyridoxal phosphate-dependent enzyme [Candidatus Hydrogenedentota bacterium]HPG68071.1 aminotransferase class III-fold pyridoxal phosphate-dependent enzyme [Candidatus Hydrogenedentota bacterium]